jgi:hypothetical protein
MNYTNLNIKANGETFKYIAEYFNDKNTKTNELKYYMNEFGIFFLMEEQNNVLYQKNFWKNIDKNSVKQDDSNLPSTYNTSIFNLYFPRYSVDLYEKNIYYTISLNVWINGVPIYLGSFLIDRKGSLAPNNGTKKFLNEEYYEYVSVETINPFDIVYSDDWKNFRKYYCGEEEIEGLQKNNSVSNINITLSAVKKINDVFVKLDNYDSTQSVLVLNNKNNDLSANLSFNTLDGIPTFNCKILFNSVYNGNLKEYLKETYQLVDFAENEFGYFNNSFNSDFLIHSNEEIKAKYCFVIGDKDNPYKYNEKECYNLQTTCDFDVVNDFVFNSWDDFVEGMYAQVYFIIQKNNEDILVVLSNKIYITQEIFKYLMDENIRKINLENINMNANNFNIVNVIENKIVTLERPNEYKSNIIKPIFVKVQEADNIRIHKSVTENICINLDAYKNKVNSFILKIGNTNFYEIGRINSGIVFKVIGTNIQLDNGYYYILNNEGELVTTGKFTTI